MKIRKTAIQKNFILDRDRYLTCELEYMIKEGVVFYIDDDFKGSCDVEQCADQEVRIMASSLDDVKVSVVDGIYTVVGTLNLACRFCMGNQPVREIYLTL